jgi:tripartite-type tricarboxylate transporter receptor subunit TctC
MDRIDSRCIPSSARRRLLQLVGAQSLLASAPTAMAQQSGAVTRIIVPFAAGGSGDILSRLLGQYLLDTRKMHSVVDLKPGASGIIGMQAALGAPADGRTWIIASTTTFATNPSLFRKLPYDPETDFTLVSVLGVGGNFMLVRPDAPYRTVSEFISHAKASPGTVSYGHFNANSQIPGALLAARAGVPLVAVPYKQIGNALTDLMSGQIHVLFVDSVAADPHVSSGRLRPIAVTVGKRLVRHPDVPAIAETFEGFEVLGFLGIAVTAATPERLKSEINALVNEAASSQQLRERIDSFGFTPQNLDLPACAAFARSERRKWAEYIALAQIQPQ